MWFTASCLRLISWLLLAVWLVVVWVACAVVVDVYLVLLMFVFAGLDLICCFGFCSGFCLVCVRLLGLVIVAFRWWV